MEPCSIRLPARADCKVSASSSTYRTSSTRQRHCHLTLLLRNTETCYPINGNWPTNQARCYSGYAYLSVYFDTFCNHKIITEVIHLLFYQALQNMFSTPFQWSYCYKFKHNCPTKCNCNTLLKKHIAYKICFIREIRVRSPSSYHSDSQQLFTMRM